MGHTKFIDVSAGSQKFTRHQVAYCRCNMCPIRTHEQAIFVFSIFDWNQLATEANAASLFKCKCIDLFLLVFPRISLLSKLGPLQYREYENGLLACCRLTSPQHGPQRVPTFQTIEPLNFKFVILSSRSANSSISWIRIINTLMYFQFLFFSL